jgi:sortase A
MADTLRKSPPGPFSKNASGKATRAAEPGGRRPRANGRFDPLRATALLFIAAGLILIVGFFDTTSQAVVEQQRLDQEWRQQVHVPSFVPAVIDPSLMRPVNGLDFAIVIPKLGYFAVVREGITSAVLYSGPGHYPQTRWPGEQGTVGVAAHNEYWINFPTLGPGDEIDLQTRYGVFRYHMTGSRIVGPSDKTVLVPNEDGYHLTLTTCWPVWAGVFATKRYVIFTTQFSPRTELPINILPRP